MSVEKRDGMALGVRPGVTRRPGVLCRLSGAIPASLVRPPCLICGRPCWIPLFSSAAHTEGNRGISNQSVCGRVRGVSWV